MSQNVLSIPAGKSENLIHKWHVYMCPDTPKYSPKFIGVEYICFRHEIKGIKGATDRIYKLVKRQPLDLRGKTVAQATQAIDLSGVTMTLLDLQTYIRQYEFIPDLKKNLRSLPHLLVFLAIEENGRLDHLPRVPMNSTYWTKYSKDQLLNLTELPAKS